MSNSSISRFRPFIYASVTVFFWSTVASAFKITLDEFDFVQVVFFSTLFSTVILLIILLASGKFGEIFKQSWRDIASSAVLGFLNPFAYYLVLMRAYTLLPAQEAQPLNFTWPIILSLLSVPLLGKKLKLRSLIALVISFFGVIIISTKGDIFGLHFQSMEGTLLAVGSSVIWALYWIFNVKDKREPVVKLFFSFLIGSIYVSIAFAFFGLPVKLSFIGLGGSLYIGAFEMGVTFVLWLTALSTAKDSAKIANFVYLSPFISLIFIYFIVGEKIMLTSIIGLVLIIFGILVQNINLHRKKER